MHRYNHMQHSSTSTLDIMQSIKNTNKDMWNIRKIIEGYTMFLKRKQSRKIKAKVCAEGQYHQDFNHKLKSSSHFVPSDTHVGFYVTNIIDYNYKLRSVIG